MPQFLRILPRDPAFSLDHKTAGEVVAYLLNRVDGVRDAIPEIWSETHFFTHGRKPVEASCPNCHKPIPADWLNENIARCWDDSFTDLAVVAPCCGRDTTLDQLAFRRAAGFAHFMIRVYGSAVVSGIPEEHLRALESLVRCELKQLPPPKE
ncbi:hypothetical protein SH528x_003332 [Novipirellula sp. SH528]|uniref:hypothetical protein n=1 Tax=Novipirellula sp. SH528 TaxID=3454466 RepID=UPI003F9FB576